MRIKLEDPFVITLLERSAQAKARRLQRFNGFVGVPETVETVKGVSARFRHLPEGESSGGSGEAAESLPKIAFGAFNRPFGTDVNANSDPAVNCRAILKSPSGRLGARRFAGAQAFTMIEIALSVAIVAFALVAILGVLPTGMRVQKDNREDTVVNQDGLFLIDAIRGSTRTLDELTNYVESITISNSPAGKSIEITNFAGGEEIVGLLTTLRTPILNSSGPDPSKTQPLTIVKARMRSITGSAGDKANKTNEFAFRYQVIAETIPVQIVPPVSLRQLQDFAAALPIGSVQRLQTLEELLKIYKLNNYMFDLRLTLQWPMYEQGNNKWQVGRFRKTFRTVIAGTLSSNTFYNSTRNLTFIAPNIFTNILVTNKTTQQVLEFSTTTNFFLPYAL